jgi:hypothetical protein
VPDIVSRLSSLFLFLLLFTMDKLIAKMGRPPFQLAQFYSLRQEWTSIKSDMTSASYFDQKRAIDMIEVMEALAPLMDDHVLQTFPELDNEENQASDGLRWGCGRGFLRRDLHGELYSVFLDIIEMKALLFKALELPEICSLAADCVAVCQYCKWILVRCGRGLHCK